MHADQHNTGLTETFLEVCRQNLVVCFIGAIWANNSCSMPCDAPMCLEMSDSMLQNLIFVISL